MASTVTITQQTVGVRLTFASQDPLTITDTGAIQRPTNTSNITSSYGVYGASTQSWLIGNAGTVEAEGNLSFGITLSGSGTNGDGTILLRYLLRRFWRLHCRRRARGEQLRHDQHLQAQSNKPRP